MKVLRTAFSQPLDPVVTSFVSSIDEDKYIINADLDGSLAHVSMLEAVGLIKAAQATKIKEGLAIIKEQYSDGTFNLSEDFEDVHMNIEVKLEQLIGSDAKLLHTARSRNDQVALDIRLYVLQQISGISSLLQELIETITAKAAQYSDTIMPGYTHLQHAQPVSVSHSFLSFVEMLKRDLERLKDCAEHTDCSPLGAGALAGSSLPIEPELSAKALGFSKAFNNSIDAVSDRDFACEFVFVCSMIAIHLSQIAENLIIWTTKEFGFVTFSDAVTTTSSLMPQKKNPDPIEIVRAKSGAVCGDLFNILMVLKAQPIGYNRDLQETKKPAINAANVIIESLKVMVLAFSEMTINGDATLEAASAPELFATDLLEYLVLKGVPFRKAHETIAELVSSAREKSQSLKHLPLTHYRQISPLFRDDIYDLYNPAASVARKNSPGGTGSRKPN
ncbi:MAG: argininosuccinate lyase [Candidatus Obscuribacterales bacterium]|nr:argininosuccinate lyase [Candidatus Obscuribacterales bacterium]